VSLAFLNNLRQSVREWQTATRALLNAVDRKRNHVVKRIYCPYGALKKWR